MHNTALSTQVPSRNVHLWVSCGGMLQLQGASYLRPAREPPISPGTSLLASLLLPRPSTMGLPLGFGVDQASGAFLKFKSAQLAQAGEE